MTDKEAEWTGPTHRDQEDIFVYASWTATMTEMKKAASMDVSEGKLVKKVSGCRFNQNDDDDDHSIAVGDALTDSTCCTVVTRGSFII